MSILRALAIDSEQTIGCKNEDFMKVVRKVFSESRDLKAARDAAGPVAATQKEKEAV